MFEGELVKHLVDFLAEIGISAIPASSISPTLFPGLDIQRGAVLIDETRLVNPGDILHEAGHIAVTAPSARYELRVQPTGGQEVAALAWSYAAALHLGLPPSVVFYPASYHDFGNELVGNFADGRYIGVPLLQTYGMTLDRQRAERAGASPYPHMLKWLRP